MNPLLVANAFFGGGPVGLIAKSTALLLGAALIALLLPRASAAARHLVWLTALAGCAALVMFSPVAPSLVVRLPVADDRPVFTSRTLSPFMAARENYVVSIGPVATIQSRATRPLARTFARTFARAFARPFARSFVFRRSSPATWTETYAATLLAAVWAVGFLVVLARCVLGHVAVARIVRRARPVTSPEWNASLIAAMVGAGARRMVELLISDELSAPVTTGFIHPVILLPARTNDWSDERRRVVLVHEVAHVVRFDYAAQLVATLAGAMFWFHPLAWLASARLRAEAENAADDRVLAAGTAGVAYAGHLLDLARMESSTPLTAAVAVGMVRASRLERRFRAMLDTTRSRAALPRRLPAVATSLTLAAMIPLAGARTTIVPGQHAHRFTLGGSRNTVILSAATTGSLTAIALAEPTALAIATLAPDDSTIEKTIDATGGDRLVLNLETGGSVVVHAWDEPRIRMRARLGGRDWRDERVTLERTRNGVRLQSQFFDPRSNSSTDNTFELWVPRHVDIDLSSAGGSLAISDLTGEFRGHTGGGAITIEGATGTAMLTTGGGDVSVTNSTLSGSVSTGGGGVYISNVSGGLTGSSGSGPVVSYDGATTVSSRPVTAYSGTTTVSSGVGGGTIVSTTSGGVGIGASGGIGAGVGRIGTNEARGIGGGIGGGIGAGTGNATTVTNGSTNTIGSGSRIETTMRYTDVRTGVRNGVAVMTYTKPGGDIVLDEIPRGGRISTGGGRVYVGSSGGFLNVSTGGGDVDLPQMGGDANVWTGAGTVTITVVNTDGTEHRVDVFSGSGRVVLDLPSDLDATIELESAYTENLGHKTSIESEVALAQSETQSWDDRNGSPRKYVRARGTVGNGRGLIRVHTVNGDILVRRR